MSSQRRYARGWDLIFGDPEAKAAARAQHPDDDALDWSVTYYPNYWWPLPTAIQRRRELAEPVDDVEQDPI